jgi:hypothetical protein
MTAKSKRFRAFLTLALFADAITGRADIAGDFTLAGDQTFTSTAGDTFTIGGGGNTFDLQGHNATFTGQGNFAINSGITGTGGVLIDLTDSSKIIEYQSSGNSYSGLTTVRSGILLLDTPSEGNDGIAGNLYIGGGPNQATVTRHNKHNRELIADTRTITIASNGTLNFQRMDTGNSHVHDGLETFGKLILDGGTLLNSSHNSRVTTVNILDSIQLLSSSVIDLGVAMTMNIGDVDSTPWTPDAILTIKGWSDNEPIYVGQITPSQLGQIRFDLPGGLMGATQIADGQIIPSTLVPEASAFLFIPLLAAAAIWPELKRRRGNKAPSVP